MAQRPELDEQRLFRELCWLCGTLIGISLLLALVVALSKTQALPELVGVALTLGVAVIGVLLNPQLSSAALRLPNARGALETLLVAAVAGPSLELGFWVLQQLGFKTYSGYLDAFVREGLPVALGFVAIAVVTPISEEVLFRGLIQPKLEQIIGPTEALIVQAAIFSALHLSPVILVTHFIMGLAFGWIRRRTGSLLPSILLHGAWNAWTLWSALASTATTMR